MLKRELKKQLYTRWDEITLMLVVEAGFFLFGELMLAAAVYGIGGKERTVIPIGTMLAVCVPVILMVFFGMSSLAMNFNLAVSMGSVRSRYVMAMLGVSYLQAVALLWIADLFYALEQWIFRVAYAGMKNELEMGVFFQWKYILPVSLAVVAIAALIGALFLRFGKGVFVIFWIFWMAAVIGGPQLAKILASKKDNAFLRLLRGMARGFRGFPQAGLLVIITAISVAMLAAAWMVLRRQQVVT